LPLGGFAPLRDKIVFEHPTGATTGQEAESRLAFNRFNKMPDCAAAHIFLCVLCASVVQ
jgi:hypothetical protein